MHAALRPIIGKIAYADPELFSFVRLARGRTWRDEVRLYDTRVDVLLGAERDDVVVAVSPSTVYRVDKLLGLDTEIGKERDRKLEAARDAAKVERDGGG